MNKYASALIGRGISGKVSFIPQSGCGLLEPDVRHRLVPLLATLGTACAAFSYEPAGEQEFQQIASGGCRNRDGDFIIRGLVSNADEDTVVLFDPDDSRNTLSLSLPGSGPLQRAKATNAQLDELREARTPVVVTLRCQGDGTPIARSLSYVNADGTRESISY